MKLTSASGLVVFLSISLSRADWPGWRGAEGTGVTSEKSLPEKWSAKENVKWRVDLPERSNSSPIVWGEKVFVSQAIGADKRRTLICFNRADGKQLWQSGITYTESEQTQRDNPFCSATPVTDGERVIVSYGSAGLYCYDMGGKEIWHREFGKMSHMFGNGASPMLAGNACVFNFGPDEKARLLAGDKIYLPNQAGDVFILRAGPNFEVLATNSTGEPTNASLAADKGEIFIRTDKGLWCIAQAK